MSRQAQAQLPPRCPLQKRATNHQAYPVFSPPSSQEYVDSHPRQRGHQKSMSQSFILENDQPTWLNDLLNDSDTNSYPILHRRTASDSLSDPMLLQDMDQLHETESADSCGSNTGLEPNCSYGPNSPRRKDNLGFPEKEIVSAFSEYSMQNPMQPINRLFSAGNICGSVGECGAENKLSKRHPGQRSRARKLQYIAELERTVDFIQNMGSELSVRVASLLQQRTALSMEKNTLKQQLLRLQQEKYAVDGEYRSLKKEVERLRSSLPNSSNDKVHSSLSPYSYIDHSEPIWNMLDMRKLDLN